MSAYEDGHADGYKEGLRDAGHDPSQHGAVMLLAFIFGAICGAVAVYFL